MQPESPSFNCRPGVSGRRYVVASGHQLASMAGSEILRAGGNAIDAGVAAGLALGVLESEFVSVAGVAPIILYSAERDEIVTISGLGVWPRAARREDFAAKWGRIPPGVPRTVVPAAPDAWITALEHYGTMGFADVASFAIEFAAQGFPMYPTMAGRIADYKDLYASYPSSAAIYLPDGEPPALGSTFVQSDLAASLQFLADEDRAAAARGGRKAGLKAARDAFYRGDIAHRMVDFHKEQGGLLTLEDLDAFSVEIEKSTRIGFRDWEVHGCGPWCQGPMLLQTLKIIEGFDIAAMGHNSPEYLHLIVEALKLAAGDRERFYGDPRFVDVPMDMLLADDYAAGRRRMIDQARAFPDLPPGGLDGYPDKLTDGGFNTESAMDTSYLCAVDRAGNVFSATPSDGSYNAPVVPGLGFIVSSRGQQSWLDADHPSSLEPGKRPRLTPNPAIAVQGDRMVPFGSPGGDVQTQAMLQTFLNFAAFGFDLQTSVELPRVASYSFPSSFDPHRSEPGVLRMEGRIPSSVGDRLTALGHKVERWPDYTWLAGSVSMIDGDRRRGHFNGASDPRRAGYAIGW